MNNKNKRIIVIIDLLIYLLYSIIGFFIMLFILMTSEQEKFENLIFNYILIFIGFVHIFIGILFSILFYTKERTKMRICINKPLLIYNSIMTVLPYITLGLLELAAYIISP